VKKDWARSVTYLVDGNNVMGQRVGWHRDKAGARRRLLAELTELAREVGEPVDVVFDGLPDDDHPDGSTVGGVRVYYAGRGSDADTRIRRLVEDAPEREGLKVVTSDRRLAEDVRRHGVQVIRSGQLRRRLDALGGGEVDEAGYLGHHGRGREATMGPLAEVFLSPGARAARRREVVRRARQGLDEKVGALRRAATELEALAGREADSLTAEEARRLADLDGAAEQAVRGLRPAP
jgi:predicted RNA-binding protein with PIN domain